MLATYKFEDADQKVMTTISVLRGTQTYGLRDRPMLALSALFLRAG